jgi:hypothetical protein
MELIQQQLQEEINLLKGRIDHLEKERMIDSREEPVKEVIIKKTEKKEKNSIPLPWLGNINEECCRALRVNHGLFTQCENQPISNSTFCKTCHNQGVKNGSNVPNSGTVDDRLKCDALEFADKKSGKKPTPWCQVLSKLNISKEDAMKYVNDNNIVIPDQQMTDTTKKRGRPKKNNTPTEGGLGDESPKKKRGRPRKEKVGCDTVAGDDLIANMIADLGELEEEKVDDEDETEVKKLNIDGKDYLIDNENTVYDMESQEELGFYDKDSNSIIKDGFE